MPEGFKITWRGPPAGESDVAQLKLELTHLLESGLDAPEQLGFHTCILTEDYDGPSINVFGDPKFPGEFICEYSSKTRWVTLTRSSEIDLDL